MNNNNLKQELQVCNRCGNMFWYSGVGKCICDVCKDEEEEQFNVVKNYIYEHLSATIMEVSKETGVRVVRIKSFIREGRLVIPENSQAFINCEVCGANIKFGRVCPDCARSLDDEIKKTMNLNEFSIGEKPNPNLVKMKFLNRD